MNLYGQELSRRDFLKLVGSVSQIGGIECSELQEGNSRGVRTVQVKTAEGLEYTIAPDCGMNIVSCSFRGIPVCWKTGTGVVRPRPLLPPLHPPIPRRTDKIDDGLIHLSLRLRKNRKNAAGPKTCSIFL